MSNKKIGRRKEMKGRFLFGILASVLLLAFGGQASAEFPDRPITLIANYSAGGGADLSARALAKKAEKTLGQPVAVVNRAGAGERWEWRPSPPPNRMDTRSG